MTEKWGQIQGKRELVRVNGGVRVIRVRITGVVLYVEKADLSKGYQNLSEFVF